MCEMLQKPLDVNAKARHVLARVVYIEKQRKIEQWNAKKAFFVTHLHVNVRDGSLRKRFAFYCAALLFFM